MPSRRPSIDSRTRLAVNQIVREAGGGPTGPAGPAGPATTDASLLSSGTVPLARLTGLTNAQLDAAAAIDWTKISKAGSSLADLVTRSAADLSSGTLPLARLSSLTNAQIDAAAAIAWLKIDKTGSALADLATRSASSLNSGTLAKAQMHADYPDRTVAETIAGAWAFTAGLKERGRTAPIGEWTAFAYAAGTFTASGTMTWTVGAGDQIAYRYQIVGKTLIINFDVETTTVGGTVGAELRLGLPGGYLTASACIAGHYLTIDNGAAADVGYIRVIGAGQAYVQLRKRDTSNWTLSTDNTSVIGTAIIEVQ